ncbi:MAG: MFS transporter [Anaerolineaceae bacterium]|nr:MFS transporter [Anaerolineaceae bacterium]
MQENQVEQQSAPASRWMNIFFTFNRLILNTNSRIVYPFINVFARGLGVGLPLITLAITIRSISGTILSPLFGVIPDRVSRKFGMLLGIFLTILGSGLLWLFPGYLAFVAFMILTYIGALINMTAIQAYIGDVVPYRKRGEVIAITELGWSLSFILMIPFFGLLIDKFGWISPFPVLTVLEIVLFFLVLWLVPGIKKKVLVNEKNTMSFWEVFRLPAARRIMGLYFCMGASIEVLLLVFGVWMEDSFGLKIAALGAASAVIGFAELGGESLSAVVADRFGKKRSVRVGLIVNILITLSLTLLGRSLVGALIGLFLFYLSMEFTYISCMPILSQISPKARATLLGIAMAMVSLGRAAAAIIIPPLYSQGFFVTTLAAVFLNFSGILFLNGILIQEDGKGPAEGSLSKNSLIM